MKTISTVPVVNGTKPLRRGLLLAVALLCLQRDTPAAQAPVALGSAATFGVLGASTVTSTGGTVVNGDLGVSPGTAVTGSPGVSGTLHAGDAAAALAQSDLTLPIPPPPPGPPARSWWREISADKFSPPAFIRPPPRSRFRRAI